MKRGCVAVALAALLAGCTMPRLPGDEPSPDPGPVRTSWQLQHRLKGLTPVGAYVSGYGESTQVRVGNDDCSASVSAPGQGGPDNKLGERTAVTVRGRPGFRGGAGAEGAYLMWQRVDGSWIEANCSNPDDRAGVDRVAAAIELKPSSVRLPFTLDGLPDGLRVSLITQDLTYGPTSVYLRPEAWNAPGYVITLQRADDAAPTGQQVQAGGRTVLLDADPAYAVSVCLPVQSRSICVQSDTSDTGMNPDRTADVPVFLDLAGRLRAPSDLADLATWFPAERVFG